MKLRSTTRVGTSLLEYVTFLFIIMFFVFAFSPAVRTWIMENLFR